MPFAPAPDAYERYVGRTSREIAPRFRAFAGVPDGPVLDVGCGPGALAASLAARLGAVRVTAIDPSPAFVETCIARLPRGDVRVGSGEALPFSPGAFDAALSQLVLPFARDLPRFLAESRRVVKRGGIVAACTFAHFPPEETLRAALRTSGAPEPEDVWGPLGDEERLRKLWADAGLRDVSTASFDLEIPYEDFDDFWAPLQAGVPGVGPAGTSVGAHPAERREAIRDACFALLGAPEGGFFLTARVVAVRGLA